MRSSLSTQAVTGLATVLLSATVSYAMPSMTYEGCFSSSDPLEDQGSYIYQTTGYCQEACYNISAPVMALYDGSNCFCGDLIPANDTYVSEDNCNVPCNGYNTLTCGGGESYAVFLTGIKNTVEYAKDSSASTTSSATPTATKDTSESASTTHAPSVVTQAGQTVMVTSPATSNSGPNKAAIAAGVVVGVVVLAALAGGAIFFLRARKRREVEEEYRRNAALNTDYNQKPTSSSSMADSRLDPSIMAHRRQSDGSIADNEDFSRRILKVTNPDRG